MSFEDGRLDADGRPVDHVGRVQPHRFNAISFIRAIPGFLSRFRDVPATHFEWQDTGAVVTCVCGNCSECDTGRLIPCQGCERIFLYTGRRLLVANTPQPMEEAPMD